MHMMARTCVLLLWSQLITFVTCQDCTLEQFKKSHLFDSNFNISGLDATYSERKQVRVPCNPGYTGFFKMICSEGKWISSSPKCELKSCGHPGDAQFADFRLVVGDDYVFGSEIVYECNSGYHMVSRSNRRRCVAGGWDGIIPVCEATKCPAVHADNNVQILGDAEEATSGNVVRFRCKSSAEILHGSQEIYCKDDGEWSGPAPTCKVNSCKIAGLNPNLYLSGLTPAGGSMEPGQKLRFLCGPGYQLDGSTEIECLSTGQWSDSFPSCSALRCSVPQIENGHVLGAAQEYKEQEFLDFTCDPLYKRADERTPRCTKFAGKADWSPTPACKLIKCELTLASISGTTYDPPHKNMFSPGETVRVTCGEKHWILDTQTMVMDVTCGINGDWNTNPICQGRQCENPNIENSRNTSSSRRTYYNGDRLTYQCLGGNQESVTITCERGAWEGIKQCPAPSGCSAPPALEDGDTKSIIRSDSEYQHGEKVEYLCQNMYTMAGGPFKTCDNGLWKGDIRCLKACTVNEEVMREHGITFKHVYETKLYASHKDLIEFRCVRGKRRVGTVPFRVQCNDGQMTLPTCW